MTFSDQSYNLRIELDTHQCELSSAMIERFETALDRLREPVKKFPVSDLYITVTLQSRTKAYRVRTALVLPGRTLAAGDLDRDCYAAFERCVRKIARRLEAYQANLGREAELSKHQKGTQQEVVPEQEPDGQSLEAAAAGGDYRAFRQAMLVYEEPIRKRIGRWIKRYPQIESRLGEELSLADLVEEVFLNAFERYQDRPRQQRLGDWLEQLIDPSVKLIADHPDDELESIAFARTLREMEDPDK